jgi:hypothetical protein
METFGINQSFRSGYRQVFLIIRHDFVYSADGDDLPMLEKESFIAKLL